VTTAALGPPVAQSPPGPGELHRAYEELRRLLAHPQPPIVAAVLEERFVRAAMGLPGGWKGYAFPVAVSLAERIVRLSFEGLDPDLLESFEETLRRARDLPPAPWPGTAKWPNISADATDRLAKARAELESLLSGDFPRSGPPGAKQAETSVVSIRVPLVATLSGGPARHPLFADIVIGLPATLDVSADLVYGRSERPELSFDATVDSAVKAGLRNCLAQLAKVPVRGAPAPRRCWFRAKLSPSEAYLIGRSACLPFFLAASAARSLQGIGWEARGVPPGIAATGRLEETKVLPVEASTLAAKVRACFFSPIRVLCVPFDQRHEALAEVRRLEARYPLRQLGIRDVEDARELWYDLPQEPRRVGGILKSAVRLAVMSRAVIVIAAAAVVLALGFIAMELIHLRAAPVRAEWRGSDLVFWNGSGHQCAGVSLTPAHRFLSGARDDFGEWLAVWNADSKGSNEVVALHCSQPGDADFLTLFNGRGRALWTRRAEQLDPADDLREDVFWWYFYRCTGADGDPSILTLRRSRQTGLCLVDVLHGASGRYMGRLISRGHLEGMVHIDLDRDGTREFVAFGTDNPSGRAVLAVVDPSRMRPERTSEPTSSADLLDPEAADLGARLVMTFSLDRFSEEARAGCGWVDEQEDGGIAAHVAGAPSSGILYFMRFEPGLRPVLSRVQLSDAYRALIRTHSAESVPDSTFAAEEARLGSEVRLLSGAAWRGVEMETVENSQTPSSGY